MEQLNLGKFKRLKLKHRNHREKPQRDMKTKGSSFFNIKSLNETDEQIIQISNWKATILLTPYFFSMDAFF